MDTLYTLKDGEIVIHPSMYNHKLFKDMVRRDRGGIIEGDANGTKKLRTMAEIGFVWYCINLNSPGVQRALQGSELEQAARSFFGLPDNWKKDEAFDRFYEQYKTDYFGHVVVKSIRNLLEGFEQTVFMTEKLNLILKRHALNQSELTVDNIGEIITLNKNLMAISADLPNNIDKLKALEVAYLREEKKIGKARGGAVITSSMIPDRKN